MNPNPFVILVIVALCAAVFGGIVLVGLETKTVPPIQMPTPPITSRIPDILNLPGFGNPVPKPVPPGAQTPPASQTVGTKGPDVIVQQGVLPQPALAPAPQPPQAPRPSNRLPIPPSAVPSPIRRLSTPPPMPSGVGAPTGNVRAIPPSIVRVPQKTAAAFSALDSIPQLNDFRTQMVKEGVIAGNQFVKIANNADMEQFMLKLVKWQAEKAGSTAEQIQDALDRITKAYDQVRSTHSGR